MNNTQFTVENRRNWKGQVVDYDKIRDYSDNECQYCLTDAQIAVIAGIIEPLAWATRWQSETQPIDTEWIRQFRDDIDRRLMMGCCGNETPIQYRYTPSGVLQKSTDGGVTWEDAPLEDPRNNSPIFPPIPGDDGDDKKCNAATGAAELIKQQIGAQLTDDMTRYTLQQLIKDWLDTMIQTSNPFEALALVVSNQIFALLISVVRPALTDAVYHQLACILDCRMNTDASFGDSQWENVRSDITSQIGGVAGVFLEHLIYMLGKVGLTNLVRNAPVADGDCADCECAGNWCLEYDFRTSDYGIAFLYGSYSPGVGIIGTAAGSGVSIVGNVDWMVNTTVNYFEIEVEATGTMNVSCLGNDGATGLIGETDVVSDTYISGNVPYNQTDTTKIILNPSSGAAQGANVTMIRVYMEGVGTLPPDAELCDPIHPLP